MVKVIEPAGDLPGKFEMGKLILAYRDSRGPVDKDISRLEDRIT